jgi:alpha-ketoglutarate-dependent taurine dioxygenase
MAEAHSAPRTLVEELLAEIWSEVLGLERVGVTDSFFALGGHSLLALKVQARARQLFHVDVPAAQVFETPTIRGMAQAINAALRAGPNTVSIPIPRADRSQPLPLSSSQQRLWFLDQLQPGSASYNIAGATRLNGHLDVQAFQRAFNEIIARHEALRASFSAIDGNPVQLIAPQLVITAPVVDLSELPETQVEAEIQRLTTFEAQRAFDLRTAPLLRIILLRESEESHVLFLTMHHIVSDAWSLVNFSKELGILYEAFSTGREADLEALPVGYADYVAWQQELLQGEAMAIQRAYWKKKLGGQLAPLRLPSDHLRRGLPTTIGAAEHFQLPDNLSDSLRTLGRSEGSTLFMLLLAALQAQLCHYSGQEDIVVGTDVAGRDKFEFEGLIGFFINTLVLRTDLAGDPTFRELLGRVRAVTLEALAHQDLPFHELVRELQPARGLGENPLFQVMFIMQNTPDLTFSLPGLTLASVRIDEQSSAFDLSVSIEEENGGHIGGSFRYSSELFEPETIARMIEDFVVLLGKIVADPDARLSSLGMSLMIGMGKSRTEGKKQSVKFEGLTSLRPRTVSVKSNELVKLRPISPSSRLPLVIEPAIEDFDLTAWASQNRGFIEENLYRHGAILFRGFEMNSLSEFETFARATSNRLMTYGERSSPRTPLGGLVYTSTDYPANQDILLHNEQSYTLEWPMRIWFFCKQPAARAGATPLADSRKLAIRLSDIADDFERRYVMYVRNYGAGLGLPWQEVFQTSDRTTVEEHCRRALIQVEWRDDKRLRTRQVRAAIRKHPRTGETVWFNHALFFHVSSLDLTTRESVMKGLPEADWPFNTYYGDGSPIEPHILERIRDAYQMEKVSFAWQKRDILMVDNMLVAHGREAFEGPRKIAVVMGDPFADEPSFSQH